MLSLTRESCKHAGVKRSHFGGSPELDSTGFRDFGSIHYIYSDCKALQRFIWLILHKIGKL